MLDNKFWEKYFSVYDHLNELIPYNDLLDLICNKSNVKHGSISLDIGSGTGNLSIKLERFGAVVYALDYSKVGIDIHRKKYTSAKHIYGDILKGLPFSDNFFDSVVSNNVLYAIKREHRNFIFREIYRVTKPGGTVVLSNIKDGFKPFKIYFEHIKLSFIKKGLLKTIKKILILIVPTFKIMYFNFLVSRENGVGNYDFFKPNEQHDLLVSTRFSSVSDDVYVYSNQAILNYATK